MAEKQLNAPAPTQYVIRRSSGGVRKVTEFQEPGYTIIGNHLAQHGALSATAIGIATYIQSLPEGAPVDIRTLAGKFAEGRVRIAAALRELEAYGYLERVRRRTDDGRMVTITISYNNPAVTRARRERRERRGVDRVGAGADGRCGTPQPGPAAAPEPGPCSAPTPRPASVRAPAVPPQSPAPRPGPVGPGAPLPRARSREHHAAACALLATLRRDDPRLLLAVRDVDRLAPAAAAWLERGATPDAVRRILTTGLPDLMRHPAALLAHRLVALLPPPLPAAQAAAPAPLPLRTCDGCDRAFRAPEPGRCRDCRGGTSAAAAGR
ncbi:helix-turn-helix domain-containing protein [Streptomyces sp. NPDC048638]|uniref:helix-turn-helix domain-containing protein n=1 Tax=Streptomyces sp. NPDC048638 TaxID=3365580 RepID=UPI00371F9954